jgi:hypothetical protein
MQLLDNTPNPPDVSKVFAGIDVLENSKVLFCGLARNIETKIWSAIETVRDLSVYAKEKRLFVYENDSADRTPFLLKKFIKDVPWLDASINKFGHKKYGSVVEPERLENMAFYRNQCLQIIGNQYADYDYVVIMDLDFIAVALEGFCSTFGYKFDAMGSYSKVKRHMWLHYDYYAYREIGQMYHKEMDNMLTFDKIKEPHKVLSAFGGLCVYPMEVFLKGKYTELDCDHVTFNRSLYRQGHKEIFLNPYQIVVHQ